MTEHGSVSSWTHLREGNIHQLRMIKGNASFFPESHRASAHKDSNVLRGGSTLATRIYQLPLPHKQSRGKPSTARRDSKSQLPTRPFYMPSVSPTTKELRRTPPSIRSAPVSERALQRSMQVTSSVMKTLDRSLCDEARWDDPYVGCRLDPPTPPCSPSLTDRPPSSEQTDFDTELSF